MQRKKWTKAALAFSTFLFVLWWALGTGATLAWFSDVDTVRNEIQIGLLDLDVYFKHDAEVEYTKKLQSSTEVFSDQALYEPGYTQVVYFKIVNNGNVDFDYKLSVKIHGESEAVNVYGQKFYLSNYLCFGVVFGDTEDAVRELVKDRLAARNQANMKPLQTWSEPGHATLAAKTDPNQNAAHYAALILYMPEETDNVANYRGSMIPEIKLGIMVNAQQAGTME